MCPQAAGRDKFCKLPSNELKRAQYFALRSLASAKVLNKGSKLVEATARGTALTLLP